MNNVLSIQTALLEIRDAALKDFEDAVKKYDMIIGAGAINSIELRHSLETVFGIKLSLEELHQIIPAICQGLNMKTEPLKALDDLTNPKPAAYLITLYN